ncbi:PP2C family serine/threonine-protein phosphatase [Corynebacterium sp. HS2168-gen11]|uniref:PP2C family protein-serine/threonine phosphatase n=1 Tax=Corynebacterium sp. HS2168-gen11 TaxID=2974027 RepID=UPI00216AF97C|nr:protein phosphatase 2C domain-containing protein [Corynebacterium sp. HS2168-gen11]MCS4535514.1 protein phosphatase 2C domain-containing protein [Corynebacterium sp. HS2168-gen11]
MKLDFAIGSDQGLVRGNNEDSAYAGPHLLVLADGMGGHAAGEVASELMVQHLAAIDADPGENDMVAILASVADEANHAIARTIHEDPQTQGMGTTLTALMFNGHELALCHVGDSRGYRLRDGKLERLTVDDTYVQSLIDRGELSVEDASTHPQRSMILKAYTGRPVEPTLRVLDVAVGDRILLCSDGLSDPVSTETIEAELGTGTPNDAVQRMIELALRSGGPDNVTIVVADVVAESTTIPAKPMLAGAITGEKVEPLHPDTAAGRAAVALQRQSQTIAPAPTPASSSKHLWKILLAVLVLLAGGLFLGKNLLDQRLYLAVTEQQTVVIEQGVNIRYLHAPVKQACITEKSYRAYFADLDDPNCTPLKISDLQPQAATQVRSGEVSGDERDMLAVLKTVKPKLNGSLSNASKK